MPLTPLRGRGLKEEKGDRGGRQDLVDYWVPKAIGFMSFDGGAEVRLRDALPPGLHRKRKEMKSHSVAFQIISYFSSSNVHPGGEK